MPPNQELTLPADDESPEGGVPFLRRTILRDAPSRPEVSTTRVVTSGVAVTVTPSPVDTGHSPGILIVTCAASWVGSAAVTVSSSAAYSARTTAGCANSQVA